MLFSFGRSAGMYYAADGMNNSWMGIPSELDKFLQTNPMLQSLAIGEGGAYFWRKMRDNRGPGTHLVSSATTLHYPEVRNIFESDEQIYWVAFGGPGEYAVRTASEVYSSEPSMARYHNDRLPSLRCASFGPQGVWVTVDDDGSIESAGLPENVASVLKKKPVQAVALSSISAAYFVCEYTDGSTVWRVPPEWLSELDRIRNMVIILDQPPEKSDKSVESNMLFSFGPDNDLFIISNGSNTLWRGCSQSLQKFLIHNDPLDAVSMGERGSFFWKSRSMQLVSLPTRMVYPEVWNLWKEGVPINWVAFGPQGRYVVNTPSGISAWRKQDLVRTFEKSRKEVPLRCASFGYGGSWVVVEDDGTLRSHGLASSVRNSAMRGNVRNIQLSQVHPEYFYVEFMDGRSHWCLPSSWAPTVKTIENRETKPTPQLEGLKLLPDTSCEYSSVYSAFSTSWRHPGKKLPRIHYIYKNFFPVDMFERYRTYRSNVGNEQLLFHGTSRRCNLGDEPNSLGFCSDPSCTLCSVLRTSYRVESTASSGVFGIGVYTSSTSSKAAGYSKNHISSKYMTMILNRVAVGKSYFTNMADPGRCGPPRGFNSVCGLPGNILRYDETVTYNEDAIRPQYLIVYS